MVQNSGANSLLTGGREKKLPGQAFGGGSHSRASRFLTMTKLRWGRAVGGVRARDAGGCPAGAACAQQPPAVSFSTRAGSAGQRLRQAAAARFGAQGRPRPRPPGAPAASAAPRRRPDARLCLRRAEGRVRRKRAPSCGRSLALRPRRRGATLARLEPPSLAGILVRTAV